MHLWKSDELNSFCDTSVGAGPRRYGVRIAGA
jgi:hypothetical protein